MRNLYDFYITPEEYIIAENNGISKTTLETRIRKLGWTKEKALNQEVQKKKDNSKWYKVAEQNGISKQLFITRINKNKWDPEKAANEPVKYTGERNRKYSDEVYRTLEDNDISRGLFYDRIRRGWSIEKAMTTKKFTTEQIIMKMVDATKKVDSGFKEVHKVDWIARGTSKFNN